MVYRTIIDVILHLFIICNDLWCQPPFFSQTFRHNGSTVFGTMPPMCRSFPDVNKLRGMETTILGQHRPFMSIKSFVQHSGWQEMVSLCSLIRLIGVCADRDQPEFLCSRSDSRHLEVHVATAGGWLTRYRPREVRNSIYRYRKIHIDYRSKFLYRFISPISIIYGNTSKLPCWFLCNPSIQPRRRNTHSAIFTAPTTLILIQKTGILMAEKSTPMKILINKHIVMFVCILNCFAENWLILTASICSRSSLFTSTRMHVEMIVHALIQTDIQARTKSPDPQKHQTWRYIVSINLIHMQHYIWHVWKNPDNLQIWGCRDWYGKKVSLNPVSGNFFSENMGPASTWSHGRFSVTVNRSRTQKFWSATMFGARGPKFWTGT